MKSQRWWGLGVAVFLALVSGSVAYARAGCNQDTCWASIYPFFNSTNAFARTVSIDYTTFTKVRISGNPGVGRSCAPSNTLNGTWCEASHSYGDLGANANQWTNVRLCGLQSAESLHWINDDSNPEPELGRLPVTNISCSPPYPPPDEYCTYEWDWSTEDYVCLSPIIVDTGRDPNDRYRLSSPANGVLFDITATGVLHQISWPVNGNRVGFLAMDRNGNGRIDDGSELFGSNTLFGQSHGFLALANIEEHNGDHVIDKRDPLFAKLLLWNDRNRNGMSEPSELRPASEKLEAIGLSYFENDRMDRHGNWFRFTGWARQAKQGKQTAEEREFSIHDVFFINAAAQ